MVYTGIDEAAMGELTVRSHTDLDAKGFTVADSKPHHVIVRQSDTVTKDDIQLRWKVSRVGEMPDLDPFTESEKRLIKHGYNSPFEEIALAMKLNRQGMPASYPRAIFMAPSKSQLHEALYDDRRYETHARWLTPEGDPGLRKYQDYIHF